MEIRRPAYIEILENDFHQRKRANPRLSLRAYARFLGLAPPVLSEVLKGRRPIPKKDSERVATRIRLTPTKKDLFLRSLNSLRPSLNNLVRYKFTIDDHKLLEEDRYYNIIAQWEYFAVLSLMDTEPFQSDAAWIAKALGIEKSRCVKVMLDLESSGLVEVTTENEYKKTCQKVSSTHNIPSSALVESHLEGLEMAKEKLEQLPVEKRTFTSSTIAIDSNKLQEAKSLLSEFQKKFAALLENGSKDQVHQLNIQFFPLTIEE